MRSAWFWFCLLIIPFSLSARDIINISEVEGIYPIGSKIEILEDKTGELTIDRIMQSEELQSAFSESSMETPAFGFTESAYWVRFSLQNETGADAELFLEYDFAPTDTIELYEPGNTSPGTGKKGGDYYPFDTREFDFSTVVFPLPLKKGISTYYMRVQTTSALILNLHLFNHASLIEYAGGKQIWYGLFYGLLMMMLFYNAFVYLVIRDRIYLVYIVYIIAAAGFQFSLNGLAFQYLWPESVWLANNAVTLFLGLNLIMAILFSKAFLHIETWSVVLNRVLLVNLAIAAASLVIAFYSYFAAIRLQTILIPFLLFSILVAGIVSYRRGQKEAKYFLLAWGLLLVGGILKALHSNGIVPDNIVTSTSSQIGVGLEVALLSLALADRLRVVGRQMNRILEETYLVQKRNSDNLEKEIRDKTAELIEQKEKLEIKKKSIENELYIALTIQQNMIPRAIPVNYIASYYKPMIAVGGDLYDFVRFEDSARIGIFICDVVGHGVSAALTTSVVKTLILQAGAKKEKPDEFLYYMNEMICREFNFGFITMYYGVYNPETRELASASAGHMPPILIGEDGLRRLTFPRTYPVGIIPNEAMADFDKYYHTDIQKLSAGTKVLFYTDGLTECLAPDETWFEDSMLERVLMENREESCHVLVHNLSEAVIEFHGSPQFDDDICILCLDVK